MDRASQLEALCRSYPGPLSAAIYLPVVVPKPVRPDGWSWPWARGEGAAADQQRAAEARAEAEAKAAAVVAEAASKLQALHARLDSDASACALVLALYAERVSDAALGAIMPANSVRNAALLPAATPLVAMVDVDLAPNRELRRLLANATRRLDLLKASAGGSLWVLPAWEVDRHLGIEEGTKVADAALGGDKSTLVRLWKGDNHTKDLVGSVAHAGYLYPFDMEDSFSSHGPTDYPRLLNATAPYSIKYGEGYEPWFIVDRSLALPFDERWRGWFGDKTSQVKHVASHGFEFRVLPDVWLVHRPHPAPAVRAIYKNESGRSNEVGSLLEPIAYRRVLPVTKYQAYLQHVYNLWRRMTVGLRKHTYRPMVGEAMERCMATLPWWQPAG